MFIDSNFIPIITAIAGSAVSVFGLGWWLSGRFRKGEVAQRDRIDELAALHRQQLDDHEDKDQIRHEENLRRFSNISVALARLGANNDN